MAAILTTTSVIFVLVTTSLGFESAPWNSSTYETLVTYWEDCQFPPKSLYSGNGTNHLEPCTREGGMTEEYDLCNLFLKFVKHECESLYNNEIVSVCTSTEELLNLKTTNQFHLCNDKLGVRIPDIFQKIPKDVCKEVCSGNHAEHVCRLIVIFALADYPNLEKVVNETTFKTLIPSTNNETTAVDSPTPEQESPGTPAPPKNSETSKRTDAPKETKTEKTVILRTITYGQIAIYGISFLLVFAILYFTYSYRHSILTCLRDNNESPSSAEDGKGKYRKIPNFEKFVPSLDQKAKAKSFVY